MITCQNECFNINLPHCCCYRELFNTSQNPEFSGDCVFQAVGGVKVQWRCVCPAWGPESRWSSITYSPAWCSRSPLSVAAAKAKVNAWATATAANPAPDAKSCGRRKSWRCTSIKVRRGGGNRNKRLWNDGGSVTWWCVNQVWKMDRRLFSMEKETRNQDWNLVTLLSSWSRSHILSSLGKRGAKLLFTECNTVLFVL